MSNLLDQADEVCDLLTETYNANYLKLYPEIGDIFYQVRDLYEKTPNKFPKANKNLFSLIHNLYNPENQPYSEYITGPGEISKYESSKYNKTIYLIGENDHSNLTGCFKAQKQKKVNLHGKKHMSIEKYLLKLFDSSPTFIDFYVEFSVMLDGLEYISLTSGQTLWDMLFEMKGCFGPLDKRNCPYNVRMHGVDSRTIISKKYLGSSIAKMSLDIMMTNVYKKRGRKMLKSFETFKETYKKEIELFSKIRNNADIIRIIRENIRNNALIMKEIRRSTLSQRTLLDFFVDDELNKSLEKLPQGALIVRLWFTSANNRSRKKLWPTGLNHLSYLMTVVSAVMMDVYTAARMFKKFKVKTNEQYPKEPYNIIYYAGTGHISPMARFLEQLKFRRTEHSDIGVLSCMSMKGIKQPLFS